jgi:hypothetical protein
MSYTRSTDFPALLRDTGNGVRFERMPGLDWLISGMAAAGMFSLWVNTTTAPSEHQATTVWLKVASPSYAAEGTVWLWNGSDYVEATPYLWQQLFAAILSAGPT